MSYPPPPGLKDSQSASQPPASLPARPPPPAGPQPSFPSGRGQSGNSFGGFSGFQPRAIATRTHNPVVSAGPTAPAGFSAPPTTYSSSNYQQPYQQSAAPAHYQQPQTSYEEAYPQATPPQIRNPFAVPGAGGDRGYGAPIIDPEMEAQIAQWQSAYASKDDTSRYRPGAGAATGANTGPLGTRPDAAPAMSNSDMNSAANTDSGVAAVVTGADGKQKTVIRSGGGNTWQDPSLLEWDPAHFRLFVGNLAGEVTDESLHKAFSKYTSITKARVVRDKRSEKSKGYGFVSFKDGDDYFQAAREMQGKYIGSHPILLRKSTTEIKAVVPKDHKKKGGKGGKGNYANDDRTGAGVQKKQSKTKGGLKILG